jgi:electron transfer flavoprotein-quinone oxidoreductase
LAADTVIQAKAKGDFSAAGLSGYRRALEASFVMKDLKKYRNLPHWLETNPQLFKIYPDLLNDAATELFTVDGESKRTKQAKILRMVGKRRGLLGAAWDAIQGGLTLR